MLIVKTLTVQKITTADSNHEDGIPTNVRAIATETLGGP